MIRGPLRFLQLLLTRGLCMALGAVLHGPLRASGSILETVPFIQHKRLDTTLRQNGGCSNLSATFS